MTEDELYSKFLSCDTSAYARYKMLLKKLSKNDIDVRLIKELNEQAFPDNERVSIDGLFDFGSDGSMDILGIYGSSFTGFFVIRKFKQIAYIAYFAICPEMRCKGNGSHALKLLKEYYHDRQIVVDFEALDEHHKDNQQRIRRRDFYLRNGFNETGWFQFYMDTEFEIFCSDLNFNKTQFDGMNADIHSKYPDYDPHPYRKEE